jgi:hypothetical protein
MRMREDGKYVVYSWCMHGKEDEGGRDLRMLYTLTTMKEEEGE